MFWNQGDSKGALTPKNSKSIKFTMRGGFFTFWAILAHNVTAQKYLRFEILIASFKYIRTVNYCKPKKKTNWFFRFLGESTTRQSAHGFILPLNYYY